MGYTQKRKSNAGRKMIDPLILFKGISKNSSTLLTLLS